MELRKCRRSVENEAAPVIDSSSGSNDEGSAFEAVDEGTDNSASSPSLSLEAEVSESSGEVHRKELRSKHAHDIGVSGTPRVRRPKKRGTAAVIEMWSKKVHDKGGVVRLNPRFGGGVQGRLIMCRGSEKQKEGIRGSLGQRKGWWWGKEGGIGDVVVRHRCTLEAVCTLNSELEEFQKPAIEGIVWRSILKYKPFVMDRHLVRALVESWVPESKAFRIDRREFPFSVYDVALLTGLPATGRHVTFDQGGAPCEAEDVVKAAMGDHMSRERARQQTGRADMLMYRNYVSVMIELCKQNNTLDRLGLFTKLYALLVMSGLLFL